jgi:hypothetical protein
LVLDDYRKGAKTMNRRLLAGLAIASSLAGCGGSPSGAGDGSGVITEAQFAEVKANCQLEDATLRATNSTRTTTDENGVTSTITTTYKDAPADGKSIQLPESMSQGQIANAIPCLKNEFSRLGVAEAPLSLPESMGF